MRTRSGVVLLDRDRVCLIQRVRNGRTYYLFPGGGVEPGETPEQAAAREALEELGVEVELERLVAEYSFRGRRQYYYLARIVGGRFGTGTGEEMSSSADSERGSYTPVWMTLERTQHVDVRPRELCRALHTGEIGAAALADGKVPRRGRV